MTDQIDPLYIIIAAMEAEYDKDEMCDYRKINYMIEEAAELVSKRIGGDNNFRKLAELYIKGTCWDPLE